MPWQLECSLTGNERTAYANTVCRLSHVVQPVSTGLPVLPDFVQRPPTGVSYFEHKMTIVDTFLDHSIGIRRCEHRLNVFCGFDVLSVVESLPMFLLISRLSKNVLDGFRVHHMNVKYAGCLSGRFDIYSDPAIDFTWFVVSDDSGLFTSVGRMTKGY